MDISIFFESLSVHRNNYGESTLGSLTDFHTEGLFPDLNKSGIAIIGVKEDRKSVGNTGCSKAPDAIRDYLYKLFVPKSDMKIYDLGNINQGFEITDTYYALSTVVSELIKKDIVPVVLGGGQDLTYAVYLAYGKLEQTVNLVSIDNSIELLTGQEDVTSVNFLEKIIQHQPNYLFNFSNIGYQTYFVKQSILELMSNLYFDSYRLGMLRGKIEESEPVIRNADMVSFDISAIRFADAPGCKNASPNGFNGEEACQMARYAGMSDKLTSFGLFEVNPQFDINGQTAHLAAQMVWYFIEGYYNRKKETPAEIQTNFLKYRVAIKDNKYEIIFYKSNKSDRWWMDVPYPDIKKTKYIRHHLVPCSYEDYLVACNDEMPDRWWITYLKLS
jgi:formiminoglutamase